MNDGHEVLLEPLLSFEAVETPTPSGSFGAIALTSATPLSYYNHEKLKHLPVFTTGEVTRERTLNSGYTNVHSANGGAEELANLIVTTFDRSKGRVLYPCALETAHDLGELLQNQNITCVNWPVYKAVMQQAFSQSVFDMLSANEIDLVVLYSRRTAQCFAKLWNQQADSLEPPKFLAISKNVKDALPKALSINCLVAEQPNELSIRQSIKEKYRAD